MEEEREEMEEEREEMEKKGKRQRKRRKNGGSKGRVVVGIGDEWGVGGSLGPFTSSLMITFAPVHFM